jgi:hypothetical protein
LHRFEESGLGLRRSPVDLIGEEEVGEHGPRPVLESTMPALGLLEDLGPDDVRRHEIRCELHPAEGDPDGGGECLDQLGFPQSGDTFEKDVPLGEEPDQCLANQVLLSCDPDAYGALDRVSDLCILLEEGGSRLGGDDSLSLSVGWPKH